MKAVILLGTLKKDEPSNTNALSGFVLEKMRQSNINTEIIKLVDYNITPGTYLNMGGKDQWPEIYNKILNANIIIFATPIWWGNHSSEIQKVIERLDEVHDRLMETGQSALDGKVGGILITGDSDGAQHVIANISNFFNAIGLLLPPYATLSVLWSGQAKGKKTDYDELHQKYTKDYGETTDKLIRQVLKYAK